LTDETASGGFKKGAYESIELLNQDLAREYHEA
jgi:hypothetical protein